jgi:outer membrane receptor for ferrienterochelin and colicins
MPPVRRVALVTTARAVRLLQLVRLGSTLVIGGLLPHGADAQRTTPTNDSTVSVTVRVQGDASGTTTVASAIVRSGMLTARTDDRGQATLRLPIGTRVIVAAKLGFRPDSVAVALRSGQDTAITLTLIAQPVSVEAVMVTATRSERRVEDTPLRVEMIDEEEIAEKAAMSPGDIAMMLNETSGLRVQTTNPSLGGANVRIQGLRGRYSLLLADGLPLYGAQAGGLGLLQIPPVDLGRVEIIKGTASALYGSSALGGVIDLVSRRPGTEAERTALVNQTSRGGTDAVFFGSQSFSERVGLTLLGGVHTQRRNDLDADGWTDMPGYRRAVVRPRLYLDDGAGRTVFLTSGFTAEDRDGGTFPGRVTPAGTSFEESLRTRRADVGALARFVGSDSTPLFGARVLQRAILTVRGSGVEQRHGHRFGDVREDDRHRTVFAEAALAVPRGAITYLAGAAWQQETYRAADVPGFDYSFTIPAAFAQLDVDVRSWLAVSGSMRMDAHSDYGTVVNPRVSMLARRPEDGRFAGWTTRLSAGTGAFAPTPFVEETEVTGLTPVQPLAGLVAERATSGALDIGGPLELSVGDVQLNATLFGSRVTRPLQVMRVANQSGADVSRIALVNAPGPIATWGGELLARIEHALGGGTDDAPQLRVTGTYTFLRSTECDLDVATAPAGIGGVGCARHDVALTPRHAVGVVTTVEQEGRSRIGLELYYTGRQRLDGNPYRAESRPYLIVGLMGERAIATRAGTARLFLNLENLTDVRQTRDDRLVLPVRGAGGRWTTDAWTDLAGFTVNGGVRFQW